MAQLPVQSILQAGTQIATSAVTATTGDTFPNSGNEILHVKNGSASPVTVTVVCRQASNYGVLNDLVATIPANQEMAFKNLNPQRFNDGNRLTTFVCSSATTVTAYIEG